MPQPLWCNLFPQELRINTSELSELTLCFMNICSARERLTSIHDHLLEHGCDIVSLTETWLTDSTWDVPLIQQHAPSGYKFLHVARSTGRKARGGGCLVLCKSSLKASVVTPPAKPLSFEALETNFAFSEEYYHIIVLLPYHRALPTTRMAGSKILVTRGHLSHFCGARRALSAGRAPGDPPPEKFENYTSKCAIWRHLGIKLTCNSWFKTVIVMPLQVNVFKIYTNY